MKTPTGIDYIIDGVRYESIVDILGDKYVINLEKAKEIETVNNSENTNDGNNEIEVLKKQLDDSKKVIEKLKREVDENGSRKFFLKNIAEAQSKRIEYLEDKYKRGMKMVILVLILSLVVQVIAKL